MKSDLIAAYANLTTKNTYESPLPDDIKDLIIVINNEKFIFERIYDSRKDSETGYQGHIYKNISNGDIIVVHEGSIPLNYVLKKPLEVDKDWYKANMDTLMGIVNKQFEPAEEFVDLAKKIARLESPTGKVIIVGQSLGGTLSELTGALAKNKNIETYTFNSFGAGYLLDNLKEMNKNISKDYSNMRNFTYSNEYPTRINPHIGNVFKSDYVAPKKGEGPYFHSIEVHYKNGALDYKLDSNFPNILKNGNSAKMIEHAILGRNPIITQVSDSEFVKKRQEQLVNTINNARAIYLQVSMDNYFYTVKKGETIWDICTRAGISYEKLIDVNPWLTDRFSSDEKSVIIHLGDKILIPLNEITLVETSNSNDVHSSTATGGAAGISDKFVNPNVYNKDSAEYPETSLGEEALPTSSEANKDVDFFKISVKELMKHQKSFSYDVNANKAEDLSTLTKKVRSMTKTIEDMQRKLDYHEKVVNIYNTPELAEFYLYKPVENILASILEDYCLMEGIDIIDI